MELYWWKSQIIFVLSRVWCSRISCQMTYTITWQSKVPINLLKYLLLLQYRVSHENHDKTLFPYSYTPQTFWLLFTAEIRHLGQNFFSIFMNRPRPKKYFLKNITKWSGDHKTNNCKNFQKKNFFKGKFKKIENFSMSKKIPITYNVENFLKIF